MPFFVVSEAGWIGEGYSARAAVWNGVESFAACVGRAAKSGALPLVLAERVLPLIPDPFDMLIARDQVACFDPTLVPVRDEEGNARFPEMSEPFDPEWSERAVRLCGDMGLRAAEGVIVGLREPGLLTPAEGAALARLGATAVSGWMHLGVRAARAEDCPVVAVGVGPDLEAAVVQRFLAGLAAPPADTRARGTGPR